MGVETDRLSNYSPFDVELVVNSELNHISKYKQHQNPVAVLLAGQPGAGKTVLSAMLNKTMHDDVYFINADEYRRYHPNYKTLFAEFGSDAVQMTNKFSGAVTEQLIHETSNRNINLIIEGTGRTTEVPHNTAALLVERGYQVELAVIATRPEHSLCSTLLRFYEMNEGGTIPRATAMAAHDHVVDVLPDNLDVLHNDLMISKITIWDRTPNKIYDSDIADTPPSEVLLQYWNRPWLDEELQQTVQTIDMLRAKEEEVRLGQVLTINELERRVENIPGFKERRVIRRNRDE